MAISFDHELIVFNMARLNQTVRRMGTSQEVTGWVIKAMSKEEIEETQKAWQEPTVCKGTLEKNCGTEEVKEQAVGVKESRTDVLNSHTRPLSVTASSKRW